MTKQVTDDHGDPIPISLVAHTVFCPRRAWLEAVGEKVESAQMDVGSLSHARVDNPRSSSVKEIRALELHDPDLGLVGRCDLVRRTETGVEVIEYKASPVRRRAEVTPAQRAQLLLQRQCLIAMGNKVTKTRVYFTNHKTFVEVEPTPDAVAEALRAVDLTRTIIQSERPPLPLVNDPRCARCSHVGVCLPDERRYSSSKRRISVADPDGEILYLVTPGSRASLSKGRVRVVKGDSDLGSVPLERVRGVVVQGNVDLSGALIRELMWRNLAVVWCSGRGRVVDWSRSAEAPNGQARVRQHALSEQGVVDLAREFISAKINNQATQLRRNSVSADRAAIYSLRESQRQVLNVNTLPHVFAHEGRAAAQYFKRLPSMLRIDPGEFFISQWPGRVGRGARDPLNVALNYAYGILLTDSIRGIAACGLDPSAGFLHSSGRNKPALALDLTEEFRAPIADSAVLRAVNNGEVRPGMFSGVFGDFRLTNRGRRALTEAYERRVQTEITHPTFGYRVSWRRTIEIQARMILGYLDGSQSRYVGIRTR